MLLFIDESDWLGMSTSCWWCKLGGQIHVDLPSELQYLPRDLL